MTDASATFGQNAKVYASARPGYPEALFAWLASLCPDHQAAWDCATGNGQAATGLAPYFARVFATDKSADQIAQAKASRNIVYSVQPAERTAFAAGTMDLVAVAQALHWFDLEVFWREVRRVAKPGAVFAAWGYGWSEVSPEIDRTLVEPLMKILAPYWAANNRMLWRGYRDEDIRFPFARLETPVFTMSFDWTFEELAAYIKTWSSYRLSLTDPAAKTASDTLFERARAIIPAAEIFAVRIPLALVVGRITEK